MEGRSRVTVRGGVDRGILNRVSRVQIRSRSEKGTTRSRVREENPFKGMGRSRWGSAGLLYKVVKDPTPMLTRKCF